jgi:hypothetical protein
MIHLRAQLIKNLQVGGPDAVRNALQQAIKLEHATIPLYLYALYSLDSAKNPLIADTILSVVMEEMLHMELVCNVLNALGGSPEIDSPTFIPTHPGPLPGGVEGELVVHLAPYSPAQLSAFMTVEEPETIIDFPVTLAAAAPTKVTIGQFYAEIKRQIGLLDSSEFITPPRNQVSGILDGDFEVTDLDSANKAIDTIVLQGEGTKESPLEAVGASDPAHYYRFAEIHFGKTLIKNPAATPATPPDQQFIYGGDPIPFDATGVFPVPSDPTAAGYPAGPARLACQKFNFKYTSMLKLLHAGFNGQPSALNTAVSQMFALKSLAQQMMSGTNPAGMNVGPSFDYQPTAPV